MLKGLCLISIVASIFWGPGAALAQSGQVASSAIGCARGETICARQELQTVCGPTSAEPACEAIADLSEGEAWLVLYQACRSLPARDTQTCQSFRQKQGVLIYDFKADDWRAEWETAPYPLKFDVAGAPTLRLKPGQARPLKVLVENISPLTYSAMPGETNEDDLAVISDLKGFLALAGTGIQGLVQTATFSAVMLPVSAPSSTTDTTGHTVQPLSRGDRSAAARIQGPAEACKLNVPDVTQMAKQVSNRHEALLKLSKQMDALGLQLDRLEAARISFLLAAQAAEDGKPVSRNDLPLPRLAELGTAYEAFEEVVSGLDADTRKLRSCQPILSAYQTLLGAPPNGIVVKAFAERVVETSECQIPELLAAIRADADHLRDEAPNPKCADKLLKEHMELRRDAFKSLTERLLNAAEKEEKVWTAVAKARATKKDVLAGASVLERQVRKAHRHTWKNMLIRGLAVSRQNPELPWNKVQSHEIVIKAESPYTKDLSLARGAELKRPYKLESATGQIIGYGIGLIYTPLQESTYGAITAPDGTTKVIGETGRETRAGDLAGFLSYRFREHNPAPAGTKRHVQPTIDVGVGLTSDRPAFFLGMGLEVFRAARLGFGWAPQRVSALADGQTVNQTVVTSTDDIRTEKRFDTGRYYVSFTFALDSLSLFSTK